MNTVSDLIERWPDPKITNFGRDIGTTVEHAATIKRRGSIPVRYWSAVVKGAQSRKIKGVTFEVLASIHQKPNSLSGSAA